ncbi:hypothetical protein J2782_003549 [Brucella pseudogrignonensis]|uniref:Uncharacterized protein n=1 Tax=Brucella pseudogrignonensis TaxID=419475 RepID=A0ABU1MD14_9HYPH|nr:hypothetical protein [Brucella pseudogrignonensis]
MKISASRLPDVNSAKSRFPGQPVWWMLVVLLALLGLLSIKLTVPIGPMYWDTYLYLDAAHRISTGQIPSVDFSTPVGPLGYYLFAWGMKLFPNAQSLLLAQWSLLVVAAPLMMVALLEVNRKSRTLTFALLIPFLVFAIFPANVQTYTSYPGLDGFGIYNRQVSLLLYVLTCGLMFIADGRKLAAFCAVIMLALFLTKITGFVVGGLLGLTAILAGRISLKSVLVSTTLAVLALVALELNGHMISAYIADIWQLLLLNEDGLLSRFLTVVSGTLDVILPTAILVVVLLWIETTHSIGPDRFFDRSSVWIAVILFGGIAVETQNTGSQEFIFIWPVLLMIYDRIKHVEGKAKIAFVVLAAFCVIPTFSKVTHRTLRAIAVAPTYVQPPVTELKNMRQVSARPDIMTRAKLLPEHYAKYPAPYEALARQGQLPSWRLYSELDYQMYWLISADEAVKAFKQFETKSGLHLDTLMALDFTDPFPWLLDRNATRKIQIGADPFRTVPAMSPETKAAIEATDGILRPKCPMTTSRLALQEIYADALKNRDVVALDPCWDLLLRPGILQK